jgi:hypothetical protein
MSGEVALALMLAIGLIVYAAGVKLMGDQSPRPIRKQESAW